MTAAGRAGLAGGASAAAAADGSGACSARADAGHRSRHVKGLRAPRPCCTASFHFFLAVTGIKTI